MQVDRRVIINFKVMYMYFLHSYSCTLHLHMAFVDSLLLLIFVQLNLLYRVT